MNTKYFDRSGNQISAAAFYTIFGDGYSLLKVVGGAEDDYPGLSSIQVESLRFADNSDMTVKVTLKIDGGPPADPGQFRCGWGWPMPTPDHIELVPFGIHHVDGDCVAWLTMGDREWFYDPHAAGHQGPGVIWISSPDGRILTSEQVRGVGWWGEHCHADITFAGFSDEPPPGPPPDDPPPIDPRIGRALDFMLQGSAKYFEAYTLLAEIEAEQIAGRAEGE
jgi:hypothetical protein